MSRLLKITLIIHIIFAVLFGVPLLGIPGRFLGWFGWAPIDPLISRMFGAALLGFGWLEFRTLRLNTRQAAQPLIETGIIFCGLSSAGLAWNMLGAGWPWYVWTVLGVFIVFTVLWVVNWFKK